MSSSSGAARRATALSWVTLCVLCALALPLVTGRTQFKDAAAGVQAALNVQHYGSYSSDARAPYRPTMFREPVPILSTAAWIWVVDHSIGPAEPKAYLSGTRARLLKLQNLLWLALLMASAAWTMRYFGLSWRWELTASLLVGLPFTYWVPEGAQATIGIDSLDTELIGAAFLCAGSSALLLAFARRELRIAVLASFLFGLLSLTKAAFFYVYPAVLAVLAVSYLKSRTTKTLALPRILLGLLALVGPFAALTLGWMTRNYVQTGYFQLAERGGPIVLYRGLLDGMSGVEYRGTFYAWGSIPPIQSIARHLLGFKSTDLGEGGRLQHLSMTIPGPAGQRDEQSEDEGRPEDSLTWYRQSRAAYEKSVREAAAAGERYPSGAADRVTQKAGVHLIEQHPFMHFALFLPLLLRGATLTFPLLILVLAYAWRTGRPELAVFVLPALGIVLFYAMITHFVQRYGWVPRPVATIALLVWVAALRRRDRQ